MVITSSSYVGSDAGSITLSGTVNLPAGISAVRDMSLTKTGTNTVVLSGTNFDATGSDYTFYLGNTILAGGIFSLNNAQAINIDRALKPGIQFNGGTLQFTSNNTTDYSSVFSTAASQAYKIDTNGQNVTLATALTSSGATFTKLGTGALYLTGVNTYTGGTTISAGYLELNTTGRITGDVVNNGQLGFNQNADIVFTGAISGTGSVVKYANNNLTLTASNSYTGTTTISAGTLQIGNGGATGSLGSVTWSIMQP